MKRLFDQQFEFLLELNPSIGQLSVPEKIALSKEYVLHAYTELGELLNEIPWKTWLKRPDAEPNIDGMTEEIVDAVKFLMNILIIWDIDHERFADVFDQKTEVNRQRFIQHAKLIRLMSQYQRSHVSLPKVVAIDLDGVLIRYPENWIAYLERELGQEFEIEGFSLDTGLATVNRSVYRKLKDRFRRDGSEGRGEPVDHAVEFMRALRRAGYQIVILSARPVDRYKRLYWDSIRWLREHEIPFDVMLWDTAKEDRIIKDLPMIAFAVEDDPANARRLSEAGITTYLLDRPYNATGSAPRAIRVTTFGDILAREGVHA